MWAAAGGHTAVVELLLAAGANINVQATPVASLLCVFIFPVERLTGAFVPAEPRHGTDVGGRGGPHGHRTDADRRQSRPQPTSGGET
jgi:ankyrin repeat protein